MPPVSDLIVVLSVLMLTGLIAWIGPPRRS